MSEVSYKKSDIKYNIFVNKIVDVIVDLKPRQLNNSIYNNLIQETRKFNGICYKNYGFIQEVQNIKNVDQGHFVNELDDGNVRFNLSLQCKVCDPCIDDLYYARIDIISPQLQIIKLDCGPMQIIVKTEDVHVKNKNKLQVGIYCVVRVINLRYNNLEKYIIVSGEILDIIEDENEIKEMFEKMYEN